MYVRYVIPLEGFARNNICYKQHTGCPLQFFGNKMRLIMFALETYFYETACIFATFSIYSIIHLSYHPSSVINDI